MTGNRSESLTAEIRREAEKAAGIEAAKERLAAWEARLARCVPCGGPAVEGTGLCEGCAR